MRGSSHPSYSTTTRKQCIWCYIVFRQTNIEFDEPFCPTSPGTDSDVMGFTTASPPLDKLSDKKKIGVIDQENLHTHPSLLLQSIRNLQDADQSAFQPD
jgi:hypothetical protein